jgi:hypothetical protein
MVTNAFDSSYSAPRFMDAVRPSERIDVSRWTKRRGPAYRNLRVGAEHGIGTRALAIGLGGLLLVGTATWLITSGIGFVVVGTILVTMVAYLAAASSRTPEVGPSAGPPATAGLMAGLGYERQAPLERARRDGPDGWATDDVSLQRQVALLRQQNAILAERLEVTERRLAEAQEPAPRRPQAAHRATTYRV